jgi:SAM-dependent methyltransferase
MNAPRCEQGYTGVENLEVMQGAVNYNRFLLDTVSSLAPRSGGVLDFGAGSGQFAVPMARLGFDVTALEPDERLRGRIGAAGVRTVASPAELADDSLAYVYTLNVLEHIEDDVAALRQLRAKLASGGRVVIYVPAFPLLYTSMDAKVGHIRRYTRRTLMAVVRAAEFAIERVAYVDSLGFFAALVFKALGDRGGEINPVALRLYDRAVFPLSRVVDFAAGRWFGKNLLLIARKSS